MAKELSSPCGDKLQYNSDATEYEILKVIVPLRG